MTNNKEIKEESKENRVLKSAQFIIANAKDVSINEQALTNLAKTIEKVPQKSWLTINPVNTSNFTLEQLLNYVLVLDSISFSYFPYPKTKKWHIKYSNHVYDGAQAMMICISNAIKQNPSMFSPQNLCKINPEKLSQILEKENKIPLLENRANILREVGRALSQYNSIEEFINRAEKDTIALVNLISKSFPSFEDSTTYLNQKVFFDKRTQLLASDIIQIYKDRGEEFTNTNFLTGLADYKIPQVLRRKGVIKYSPELSEKIDKQEPIVHASPEEIEIRATVPYVVEKTKHNDYLWLLGQEKHADDLPYHRTRTIAY